MLKRAGWEENGTTKKAAVLAKLAKKASSCESLQIFKQTYIVIEDIRNARARE